MNYSTHSETPGVGLTINKLLEKPVVPKISVGLDMGTLLEATPEVPKDANQEVSVKFDGLVNPVKKATVNRFALQPIPEDVDRSMLPKVNLTTSDETNAHLSKNGKVQDSISERRVSNWFTRLLDQRGQDYISAGKLTVDEVSKNAERILDDMISGRIDYSKQGQYIIQPIIINTLINYCSNKLAINKAIQYSLGYVYNDYTNKYEFTNDQDRIGSLTMIDDSMSRNITQAIAIVNQDIGIYEILYTKLKYVESTKNASSLFSLTNDLNNFKKQIKKRY